MMNDVTLLLDYPANIAKLLLHDEVDIGLMPVASLPSMKEYHVITDYCIGCDGEVASVCLFSDEPLHKMENIILDYQSRTSVALLKILLKQHWKISPVLLAGTAGYEDDIKGTTAGLVIGNRALSQRKKSRYMYDLGSAWKEMTGLPFVFAAWVSNKKLSPAFIDSFNAATAEGLNHLDEIVNAHLHVGYDLHAYYTRNIDYRLDAKKRKALDLFLDKLSSDQ